MSRRSPAVGRFDSCAAPLRAICASRPAGGGAECDECDRGDEHEAAEEVASLRMRLNAASLFSSKRLVAPSRAPEVSASAAIFRGLTRGGTRVGENSPAGRPIARDETGGGSRKEVEHGGGGGREEDHADDAVGVDDGSRQSDGDDGGRDDPSEVGVVALHSHVRFLVAAPGRRPMSSRYGRPRALSSAVEADSSEARGGFSLGRRATLWCTRTLGYRLAWNGSRFGAWVRFVAGLSVV